MYIKLRVLYLKGNIITEFIGCDVNPQRIHGYPKKNYSKLPQIVLPPRSIKNKSQ